MNNRGKAFPDKARLARPSEAGRLSTLKLSRVTGSHAFTLRRHGPPQSLMEVKVTMEDMVNQPPFN